MIANLLSAGDTQPTWRVLGSGRTEWGAGTVANPEVAMFRSAVPGGLTVQGIANNYTGTLSSGSAVVTGMSSTAGLLAGMLVTGTGIAAGASVASVDSASQITLSAAATASGTQTLAIGRGSGFTVRASPAQGTLRLQDWVTATGTNLFSLRPSGVGPSMRLDWRYGSALYEQDSTVDGFSRLILLPNGDRLDVFNEANSLLTASLNKGAIKFYDGVSNTDETNTSLTVIATNVGVHRVAVAGFGGGAGVIGIANAVTVPNANAAGGGVLYAEAGALKWRGSAGTVTVLGPA